MAVRRLILFATLVACLALAGPAWAGSLQFHGNNFAGAGTLSFTPGLGNTLTIGADGKGNQGALITDFFNSYGICGNDCSIMGGYLTLTSGGETGGFAGGGLFNYSFGAGGSIKVVGAIPFLGINSPTTLFSATFVNGTLSGAGSVGSFLGTIDLASIVLAPQLGLYKYTGASTDGLAFQVTGTCGTGGICKGTIVQSDTTFETMPEPATLSVLGVGLFAVGAGLRRKMAAPKPA